MSEILHNSYNSQHLGMHQDGLKQKGNWSQEENNNLMKPIVGAMPNKMDGIELPQRSKSFSKPNRNEALIPVKRRRENAMTPRYEWQTIKMSDHAEKTINPIRRIVDVMQVAQNPNKEALKLNLGDPSVAGNLNAHPNAAKALHDAIESKKYNGYGPATGFEHIRDVLAKHISTLQAPVTADDIILTSGCSHALEIAFEALGNPGDNILIPRPGFSVYATHMTPVGIEPRYYNLMVEKGWEVNLSDLESKITKRTKAILVNNPSNPCGAVYSKEHLQDILKIAERYKLPIIADEIYGDMTFDGAVFHPIASLSPQVPVLTADGIAKRWLVPGWRLGWLVVHDRFNTLKDVRIGLRQLAQKIVGPCAIIQGALPALLKDIPQEFFQKTRDVVCRNANIMMDQLEGAPGITPVRPYGAMYLMISIDMEKFPFENELAFVKALIQEESLYTLPGTAFQYENSIRLVTTNPEDKTLEACERLRDFCKRHYTGTQDEPAPDVIEMTDVLPGRKVSSTQKRYRLPL